MAAYFSKALFLRNLKRFWPISVAIFILAFFSFIASFLASGAVMQRFDSSIARPVDILTSLSVYASVAVPLISIVTAVAMFGYLHRPKSAGFISSLPLSRLCVYITNWLSGLTLMLAPTVLIGAIYGVLLPMNLVPTGDFFIWWFMLIFAHLLFYSMAVFAAFLTGKPVMQVFLFGLINFVCIMLIGLGTAVADIFVFGFSDTSIVPTIALLTTPTAQIALIIHDFSFSSSSAIIFWIAYPLFIAAMIFFSYLLYRHRRMESAGSIIVHKPVRTIFKYLIALLMGAILGAILTAIVYDLNSLSVAELLITLAVSVIFFGSLGCLFTEMLIRKQLRVWKTAYKSMLCFSCGIIALALFIRFDVSGYERRVPNPNNVQAVYLTVGRPNHANSALIRDNWNDNNFPAVPGISLSTEFLRARIDDNAFWTYDMIDEVRLRTFHYFESPEAIYAATLLHREIVQNRSSLENITSHSNTYTLAYRLNNGRIVTRQYVIPVDILLAHDAIAELMVELYSQSEAVNKRNRFADFPNNAILGATVTWSNNLECSEFPRDLSCRNCAVRGTMPEYSIDVLVDAMRRDVEAGTLGYLCMQGSSRLISRHIDLDESPRVVMVSLVYDFRAVGVSSNFATDSLRLSADGDTHVSVHGLLQRIVVTENNVHTMRVLRELELFD